MIKILIFHPALAPYRVDFFNELGRNVDLRVVFMTRNNENQSFDQSELLKHATYEVGYLDKHYKLKKRNINLGYWKEIESFSPNIVICNEYGLSTVSTYLHKKTHSAKYKIFTICDDSEDVFYRRTALRKIFAHFFVRKLDSIICINPKVAELYRAIGAKHVSFFPIIYNNSLFERKLQESLPITHKYIENYSLQGFKCLLFVGRFTEVKNLKRLINSFALVLKNFNQKAKLILVGDGELKSELIELANQYNIADMVIFPGRYEGNELYAWYNLKGSCVLLSTHERFGAVVAEALMAGMPAIVSDKVGANCLVSESNGIICNYNNVEEIAEKINLMLDRIEAQNNICKLKSSLLKYSFDDLMANLIKDFERC